VLAVCLAAAIQPQWTMAVWTLVLFIVVDLVAGQIVEPLLYGHRSGLSPLAVIVSAIFWSWLWGPVGLVLSTPLTLCIVTLGRYADRLNFLTVLLGDQPALTPAQNFYQRLLANDLHEAIVQAERLLGEMSIVDYYDQVVLEGLRLARNDALRGVLHTEQLARINEALVDIVENLEAVEGAADVLTLPVPGPVTSADAAYATTHEASTATEPVLCVAGRGAFDEVATAIAVQLLTRYRTACVATTYEHFRRGDLASVDVNRVQVMCVVSLDAAESPPYLRNLVRRVRAQELPTRLIVGFGAPPAEAPEASTTSATLPAGTLGITTFRGLIEESRVAVRAKEEEGEMTDRPGEEPGFAPAGS
jgi:hypothetical protein